MCAQKALITGIAGQDGSYLAELLLSKGYEVHGMVRGVALQDPDHRLARIARIRDKIHLHEASLETFPSIFKVFQYVQPDECYHLAAQSFVAYTFDDEFSTMNTNINGTHHVLAALHETNQKCRFYFAGSSEMFGRVTEVPQTESTRFHPRSAYGISKVAGFELTRNYRETYGVHASTGILFNHESPRRGFEFVTRKITRGVAMILASKATEVRLGNLDAKRDWGHAKEYVQAMWRMLRQDVPDDYVIATGRTSSVRDFLEIAFGYAGLRWQDYVVSDPIYYRAGEAYVLTGNPSKAKQVLGWEPGITLEPLVREMVDEDCRSLGLPTPAERAAAH